MTVLSRAVQQKTIVWRGDANRMRFYARWREDGQYRFEAISERMPEKPASVPAYVLARFNEIGAERGRKVITFGELWDLYLKHSETRQNAASSLAFKESLWRRLAAIFGEDVRLDIFTAEDMSRLKAHEQGRGVAVWQHPAKMLVEMFRLAVAWHHVTGLERSPFEASEIPALEPKGKPWTHEQIRAVQGKAEALPPGDPKRLVWAYVRLMLLLGTRPGELRTMRRDAVTPWGVRSNVFKRGREVLKVVEMNDLIAQAVREIDAFPRQREDMLFGYWATDATARVMIGRLWTDLQQDAGVARMKMHDARSTLGTETTRRHGIRAAQLALGHASFSTTERYYVHEDEGSRLRIDAMNDLLALPAAAREADASLDYEDAQRLV